MKNLFRKILNFIIEHRLIIIGALLLTLILFAPLIAFPYYIKDKYQGININIFGTDAHFYLTRAKEVLDGHALGSPLLREGKDYADVYLSYSDYILLAPVKLLGLAENVNIVTLYNIYNFIGVFILLLLVYFFVLQLSGEKLLAITAAIFMVGGYSMVYFKTLFYSDFNVYARLIYPYFSSLILFIYLNLLVKSLKSPELKYKILAGMVFGLLFYIYFYAWTFAFALNAVLFLVFIFTKDFEKTKKIMLISTIGLALGLYNLIGLFLTLGSAVGKQQAYFIWLTYGHTPIFSKIGFFTLILFLILWYLKRSDKNLPFIFAIILTGWICLNQQIITGRMLQYAHYYFYFIVPLSIVISLYMVWQFVKNENLRKYLFLLIIAVVFINAGGGQYKSFFSTLAQKTYEQNFCPLIDVLNRDETPGVILAHQTNEYLFTIYTSHDLFWHPAASMGNVPMQRLKDALFVYLYLNKEARNDFSGYLMKIGDNRAEGSFYQALFRYIEGYWSGYTYPEFYRRINNDDKELALKRIGIIDQLNKEYQAIISRPNGINQLLKKYGVNYVVWDKNNNPEWDLNGLSGLNLLTSFNNIYLYSLSDKSGDQAIVKI